MLTTFSSTKKDIGIFRDTKSKISKSKVKPPAKMDEEYLEVVIPDKIANLQLPDPDLLNYYKDAKNRIYYLEGEIDSRTAEIIKIIMRCNAEDRFVEPSERIPVFILIDSPGGDLQVMWSIINAIKISKTPIYTVAYCNAMSAAAHILASGHKRFAMPGSTILVHSGSCQFGGDVEKVESAKKYYDAMSKKANEMLLGDTKIMPKDLKKKGSVDWYMNAEDALKMGVVDYIVADFDDIL